MSRRSSSVSARPVEADQELSYESLKRRHREFRDSYPASLSLRTHRALSWLNRAEQEQGDHDARFVFLWIAFNSAYANEIHDRQKFSEKRLLLHFLNRLIDSDEQCLLYNAVWHHFPESIRLLIGNRHVFQPFWDYQNGRISEGDWQERFARKNKSAMKALAAMDTRKVLAIVFDRLYVLRNQVVHGRYLVNRSQVSYGANILAFVVPIVILLMMEHPEKYWGDPCYPVVEP
ncbi:MAG TPA: hypothetical protein VNQ14_14860 [Woeseiaceae bacterium]|nr:hypothetical protein [Woeseiaceae bacterium]